MADPGYRSVRGLFRDYWPPDTSLVRPKTEDQIRPSDKLRFIQTETVKEEIDG
jgi:hypothetical protein